MIIKINVGENERTVGRVLRLYNDIESHIAELIYIYFSPNRNHEMFRSVLLESGVLGMGQKLKILSNIDDFDNKIIDKIRKMMSIRNGIAHKNPNYDITRNESTGEGNIEENIYIMSSSGKIQIKKLKEQLEMFNSYFGDVMPFLIDYEKKIRKENK